MQERRRVRSIFISDVHMGCRHAKTSDLLSFLRSYDCENLFLVGDFIDGWALHRRFYWDDTCTMVVRRIFGMVKDGTNVRYIAGNHDEFLRAYIGDLEGTSHIEIADQWLHETKDGQKLLIIHGDYFDQITSQLKWMYHLGDRAYSALLWANTAINQVRRRLGLRYKSYSQYMKQNVKKAVNYVNNFEEVVAIHTNKQKCSGVVCGHIHTPVIKKIKNIDYYNCGDWVENCTAIVEHLDGQMELVHHHPSL